MMETHVFLSEMKSYCREAAQPVQPGESVKALIGKAAKALGLPASRVKGYWYNEAKQVPAPELYAARERIGEIRRRRAAQFSQWVEQYNDDREKLLAADPSLGALVPPPMLPLRPRVGGKEK